MEPVLDISFDSNGQLKPFIVTKSGSKGWASLPDWRNQVSSFILMQSSSLRDRNNKEIFDRDIIYDIMFDAKGVIKFKDGCFIIEWIDWDIDYDILGDFIEVSKEYIEVIGNVYENPELLRSEKHEH